MRLVAELKQVRQKVVCISDMQVAVAEQLQELTGVAADVAGQLATFSKQGWRPAAADPDVEASDRNQSVAEVSPRSAAVGEWAHLGALSAAATYDRDTQLSPLPGSYFAGKSGKGVAPDQALNAEARGSSAGWVAQHAEGLQSSQPLSGSVGAWKSGEGVPSGQAVSAVARGVAAFGVVPWGLPAAEWGFCPYRRGLNAGFLPDLDLQPPDPTAVEVVLQVPAHVNEMGFRREFRHHFPSLSALHFEKTDVCSFAVAKLNRKDSVKCLAEFPFWWYKEPVQLRTCKAKAGKALACSPSS